MKKNYYTKEGLERVKEELDYLENVRRKQVAKRIKVALEQGDISENAEYSEAKEEQAFVEGKVLELRGIVKNAKVITKNKNNTGTAGLGSTIAIKDAGGEKKEYTIVGSGEADPLKGRLSNESPIGKAFVGKKKGDSVDVETPGGVQKYTITNVS
ncbi:transcription elongation factor GreA [Patescibacteria group bacterium]|nr:transcription elongation factor GreA [Patescibacteria group bacterium]